MWYYTPIMTHYSAMGRAMIRIVHGVAAGREKMEIWFMLWRLALAVLSAVLCLAAAVPLRCAQAQDMQPSPFTEPSLTPIRVVTINSSACNAGLDSASEAATQAALQSALNAAAGGTLWIPAGCVLNLNTSGTISGNTTVMCAGDGIAGFHNTQGLVCAGAQPMLWAAAQSNITIKGCTFSNTYNPAN